MTSDQKLADAIIAMVQLTPGERQTVMGVVERMRFTPTEMLAEVPEATQKKRELVAKTAKLNPPLSRVEYTTQDQSDFAFAAKMWKHWSKETRENQVAGMSRHMHRTEKAIRYQITSRLK
jgi:catalase